MARVRPSNVVRGTAFALALAGSAALGTVIGSAGGTRDDWTCPRDRIGRSEFTPSEGGAYASPEETLVALAPFLAEDGPRRRSEYAQALESRSGQARFEPSTGKLYIDDRVEAQIALTQLSDGSWTIESLTLCGRSVPPELASPFSDAGSRRIWALTVSRSMSRIRDGRVTLRSFPFTGRSRSETLSGMLAGIALVLFAACLAGGVFLLRRAPVVGLGLLGGLAAGGYGFVVSVADGRRGVPADVASWASWGLVVSGVVGLLATRQRRPSAFLKPVALGFVVLGPIAAAILAVLLLVACPLYVTERAGYCYHEIDVLGGWISEVTTLFALDMVVLAVLAWISARRAPAPS